MPPAFRTQLPHSTGHSRKEIQFSNSTLGFGIACRCEDELQVRPRKLRSGTDECPDRGRRKSKQPLPGCKPLEDFPDQADPPAPLIQGLKPLDPIGNPDRIMILKTLSDPFQIMNHFNSQIPQKFRIAHSGNLENLGRIDGPCTE